MAQLWQAHEERLLEPVLRQLIVTPQFLSSIRARKAVLRARVWRDEVDAATKEFERFVLRPFTLQSKGARYYFFCYIDCTYTYIV